MSARLQRYFGVMGVAALAVVAALIALTLQTAAQLRQDVADLDRARDVQARVQGITGTLLDLETSQRGYLLTLDPTYLTPYRAGLARLDHELGRLTFMTADRDDESAQVRRLRGLIDAKCEELASTIALADTYGIEAALSVVKDHRGKALMDDIRSTQGRLGSQVAATQAQQQAARATSIRRNEQMVYLLAAMLALLLLALFALVRRDKALQARIRADEMAAREKLEQRVSQRTAELERTTRQLVHSEDRLRSIFESVSEGILTTDASQIIVEANAACARIFRCEVSDLIGTPLDRLVPARHREAHRGYVKAFGSGTVFRQPMRGADGRREVMGLRFDGSEVPIETSISHTQVDGQRLYTVVHRDLSAQLLAAVALREGAQMIAATFHASRVAMGQMDPVTHRYVAVNAALCQLSGYTEAELLAMEPDDISHPEDRIDPTKFAALLNGDAAYREQKRLIRKDGGIVWIEVTASVVRAADGHPLRVMGFVQDMTARRVAEDALRASEARQAFLVRLNDRLKALDDPRALVYAASTLLAEFLGAQRVGYGEGDGGAELVTLGPTYAQGVPAVDGPCRCGCPSRQQALFAGGTLVCNDLPGDPSLTPEDRAAYAELQIGAAVMVPLMRDAQMQAVLFVHTQHPRDWTPEEVALIEDVAHRMQAGVDRARAEALVRRSQSVLEAALRSMSDSVLIADVEGHFVEFNEAFAAFHRFGSKDECRRSLAEYTEILNVFTIDGTPAPLEQWPVPRALRGEVASSVEYLLQRKDTGEVWVASYSFAPIRTEDGRIIGAVVSGRDVTQFKKTQADLASSHASLQHLIANQQRVQEDERKRIARELHDDLQQSLAAIRMDAIAIGERYAKARTRSDIKPLLARIDRLSGAAITSARRIVSDLRPEMLEELGLHAALEALCAEHAQRSGADCRFEASAAAGAAQLDDPVLSIGLFRIAQEALNNVAKHAKATTVRVQLDVEEDSRRVTLRIVDNGVGIGAREARDPESFGLLGMEERVRAMGGQLRIQDTGDQGTRVEVLIPTLKPGAAGPALPGDGNDPVPDLGVWEVWARPLQAVIDALDGRVAVLDAHGAIQLVNRAWREFAAGDGAAGLAAGGPGMDYLALCRRRAADDACAATVLQGLGAVLEGQRESFVFEPAHDGLAGPRGWRMHAASITGGLAIVSFVETHGAAPWPPARAVATAAAGAPAPRGRRPHREPATDAWSVEDESRTGG